MTAGSVPTAYGSVREKALQPILLYDGSCGLCAHSVQFVLGHEHASHDLRFATLQGEHGRRALSSDPKLAGVDSVIWLEPGTDGRPARVLVRSEAVLAVMRHLGGPWKLLAAVGRVVPRVSRDALYRIVARYRYRVFGRDQACLLPTPDQRARFLD